MMLRIALAVLVALLALTSAEAQAPYPPNAWHPYRGGVNCIQVADINGNFSCSPLVTINPTTGAFSALGTSSTTSPVFGALVIAPSGNTFQALGNEIVLAKALTTTATAGPGTGAVTIRLRPSPITPGYCQLVVVAGNGFVEWPIAVWNPQSQLYALQQRLNTSPQTSDVFWTEFPGGPTGC